MKLFTLHKLVISASIGVSFLFALWAGWMWRARGGSMTHLVLALLAVFIAVALVVYVRYFIASCTSRYQSIVS